ncbi:hypothetical protein BZA05DRAFT_473077 [Tricharina praecox]|uniref:uncharacterized protein n=1 Tax=Tricharina praecox TaxID=43433 RepID=UPI0022207AE0|nr:uncharacterized protein BZA05DRAFT_473077 [Tricharina praecox]KAI5853688.1 hypothetical protein BZA05DRAFT_473077 [Tricharina praecox]
MSRITIDLTDDMLGADHQVPSARPDSQPVKFEESAPRTTDSAQTKSIASQSPPPYPQWLLSRISKFDKEIAELRKSTNDEGKRVDDIIARAYTTFGPSLPQAKTKEIEEAQRKFREVVENTYTAIKDKYEQKAALEACWEHKEYIPEAKAVEGGSEAKNKTAQSRSSVDNTIGSTISPPATGSDSRVIRASTDNSIAIGRFTPIASPSEPPLPLFPRRLEPQGDDETIRPLPLPEDAVMSGAQGIFGADRAHESQEASRPSRQYRPRGPRGPRGPYRPRGSHTASGAHRVRENGEGADGVTSLAIPPAAPMSVGDLSSPCPTIEECINSLRNQLNDTFPDEPISHHTWNRDSQISKVLGGGPRLTFPVPAKNISFPYNIAPLQFYIAISTDLNRFLPKKPGQPGALTFFREKVQAGNVHPLFIAARPGAWKYFGNYKACNLPYNDGCLPLERWNTFDLRYRIDWCKEILSKEWGRQMLFDKGIIPSKDKGADIISAETLMGYFQRAKSDPLHLRLRIILLQPFMYDRRLYDALCRHAGYPVSPVTARMATAPMLTAPMLTAPMLTAPMLTAPMADAPMADAPMVAADAVAAPMSNALSATFRRGRPRVVTDSDDEDEEYQPPSARMMLPAKSSSPESSPLTGITGIKREYSPDDEDLYSMPRARFLRPRISVTYQFDAEVEQAKMDTRRAEKEAWE